ncbi:11185_t:CDS:10 [Entrophospora sp. SA101]|nr:11185_t:CDS:10 [Entrophospora sp. SA101]
MPIEYPETSNEGIAYILYVKEWNDVSSVTNDPSGGSSKVECPYFGINPEDKTQKSYVPTVNLENNQFISNLNSNIPSKRQRHVTTQIEYLAAIAVKCPFNNYQCDRKPCIKKYKIHGTDEFSDFISCDRYSYHQKGHLSLQIKPGVGIKLLRTLFGNDEHISDKNNDTNCTTIVSSHISQGIHNHPPPPPIKVPSFIKDKLKALIQDLESQIVEIKANQLLTGHLIKSVFGSDFIAEVHSSVNNIDKLRYMINCVQKENNPHGQGLLGLLHDYTTNKNGLDLKDYIQNIKQAFKSTQFNYFEVDLSFKRVHGNINELEFNAYDEGHNSTTKIAYARMFEAFFEGINKLTGLGKALKKIDPSRKGKEHLRNSLMYNILSASLQEKVDEILSNLEKQVNWVLIVTSLNVNYSLVPEEIWNSTPFDTNYAESDTQIGWKYDENMYKRFEVHNNIGVTMSSKDKIILSRRINSNRKISNTKRSTKSSISQNLKKKQKRSQPQTGDNDKIIFINDDQLSTSEKSLQLKQSEEHHISLEERKLKIKEYELDLKMKELKYKKKLNKLELAPGNDK